MFRFLYKITNLINEKYYYGVHTTDNIDDNYMGSGEIIKKAIKKYGKENFKKEILEYFDTEEEKYKREAEIITEELLKDPMCYNIKIGGYGLPKNWTSMYDDNGDYFYVKTDDPIIKEKHLKGFASGKVTIYDEYGNTFRVDVDDPRYISGELKHIYTGKLTVKDKNNNILSISINDPRYLSGELVSVNKNKILIKNNNEVVSISREEFNTGKYDGVAKGMVNVKDKNGNTFQVSINDPRYLSGELVGVTKGMFKVKDKNGKIFLTSKNDPRLKTGELVGANKGLIKVKDKNGKIFLTSKNDPRLKTGELVGANKGLIKVKDKNGKIFLCDKNDPKILNGEYTRKIIVKLKYPHSKWGKVSIWPDEFNPEIHKNNIEK